jgi:UDP-glucose 4-epimerase
MDMPVSRHNGISQHYLVTGGCGFIGSHLVDALIGDGHAVTILDDLSTGKRENANPRATLIIGNTTEYGDVQRACENVDGCFHLAAIASVEKSTKEWDRSHMVNVLSTINIFMAASRREAPFPVVYTSSAAVYGNCPVIPTTEDAPKNPLTAYGADKLACDLQGNVAWVVHRVPNIGLRPFNVYGPRQDPSSPYSGVISIFMDRMGQGLPVTIFGTGEQVRDFVFVSDAVKVFVKAMEKLQDPQQACHDVINICTGRPTSVENLANTIAQITGRPSQYNYRPARQGDIYVSIGDPRHLQFRLGLRLETTLQEGLLNMLEAVGVDAVEEEQVLRGARRLLNGENDNGSPEVGRAVGGG